VRTVSRGRIVLSTNVTDFGMAEAHFQKLQKIQNRAARIVCDVTRRQQHSADLLRQLHWLPMRSRVDFKLAVLCYKAYSFSSHPTLPIFCRLTIHRTGPVVYPSIINHYRRQ